MTRKPERRACGESKSSDDDDPKPPPNYDLRGEIGSSSQDDNELSFSRKRFQYDDCAAANYLPNFMSKAGVQPHFRGTQWDQIGKKTSEKNKFP